MRLKMHTFANIGLNRTPVKVLDRIDLEGMKHLPAKQQVLFLANCAMAVGSQSSLHDRLVTVFVALGSLTYGYCASVIGNTIGQPGWYRYFDLPLQGESGYAGRTTTAVATANGNV